MTVSPRARFPWGLSGAVAVALSALVILGCWQIQRLAWKESLLAKIAALQHAPAVPLQVALAEPGNLDYRRVAVQCLSGPPAGPVIYRYALQEGRIGWRLIAACRLASGPYTGIMLDRGLVTALTGLTAPVAKIVPPPKRLIGVMRAAGSTPWLGKAMMGGGPGFLALRVADKPSILKLGAISGLTTTAPYLLAVESEDPKPQGLEPAALPVEIPNNHLIYAMTWFALAGILLWFYIAMLFTHFRK